MPTPKAEPATETEATKTPPKAASLLQIPMRHTIGSEKISLFADPKKPGDAFFQFSMALAEIVERAVAEAVAKDRMERLAAKGPCPLCGDERWLHSGTLKPGRTFSRACPACNSGGLLRPDGDAATPTMTPPSTGELTPCPACDGAGCRHVSLSRGCGSRRCDRCAGSGVVAAGEGEGEVEPESTPATHDEPASAPEPEPEPASMPAFPMVKQVDFDRLVLLRDPQEKGSAFEQFERALRGYLERHPVYQERERVVYRDRPCPICSAGDDDEDGGWDDDYRDEDEDGDEDEDERARFENRAPRPAPQAPPPVPPGFPATLRQALAEQTADPFVVREIAAAVVRRMAMGDVESIRFVEERSGRRS